LRYYFDASALVKRFKAERGQDIVREIMQDAATGTHEIYSIYWSKTEFYVAMSRANVPQKLAATNLRTLSRIVTFSQLTSDQIDDALDVVYELHLHAADATHIAACRRLDCEVIVSDDEHLLRQKTRDYLEKEGIGLVALAESR
jgi:predicted nucleic acid-binding protein